MKELSNWRDSILIPVISNKTIQWNPDELESILLKSIDLSVEKCLSDNNGEICTTLSGGLDSSLCISIVRKIVGPKTAIHTFTTGGSEQHPDIQFARKISSLFSTHHHELIPCHEEIGLAKKEMFSLWKNEPQKLGNVAVFLTYKNIAKYGFRCVIAHDGIDELLGGYWEHRKHVDEKEKIKAFQALWDDLKENHLVPLERKALHFGISVIFPYLQTELVKYISKIQIDERTSHEISKIPLKKIAGKYLPDEVIKREKRGFCDVLEKS